MSYTVKKILSKNSEEADSSLEMKFLFNLRPVNALDFYNFLKIDLLKIPKVACSEKCEYNSVACI